MISSTSYLVQVVRGSAGLKQYHDSLLSPGALLQSDFGEILRFALEMLQTYRQDREDRL
jgi:hypothetical protein